MVSVDIKIKVLNAVENGEFAATPKVNAAVETASAGSGSARAAIALLSFPHHLSSLMVFQPALVLAPQLPHQAGSALTVRVVAQTDISAIDPLFAIAAARQASVAI